MKFGERFLALWQRFLREEPLLWLFLATFLVAGVIIAVLGPAVLYFQTQTQSSLDAMGNVFSARAFGVLCGALALGGLFSRPQRGVRFLALATACVGGYCLAAPHVTSLYLLCALVFVYGAMESAWSVGCNTYLSALKPSNTMPYMNALHACFGLGAILAPICVFFLKIPAIYTLLGLICCGVLAPAFAFLKIPTFSAFPDSASAVHAERLDIAFLLLFFCVFFFEVGVEVCIGGWIYTFLMQKVAFTHKEALVVNTLYWVSFTAFRILLVFLSRKLSVRFILFFSLGLTFLSLLLPLVLPFSFIYFIVAFLLGISTAGIFPQAFIIMQRTLHLSGRTTSLAVVASSLGAIVLPRIGAFLLEKASGSWFLVFLALATLFSLCAAMGIELRRRMLARKFTH